MISIIGAGCEKNESGNFVFENDYSVILEKYQAYTDCLSPDDAIPYPEPWTQEAASEFEIPEEVLCGTSTCGLIGTFSNQPWIGLGPWLQTSSSLDINGIEIFNAAVSQNEVIQELLSRNDAADLLSVRYGNLIENFSVMAKPESGEIQYLEMLLASDAVRPLLTKQQAEDLIILSLKMLDLRADKSEASGSTSTVHILLSTLIALDYDPFLTDSRFNSGSPETWLFGYKICSESPSVIAKYAEDYINSRREVI